MRITFVPGDRTPKVIAAIIKDAPGKPLYFDKRHAVQVGEVSSIQPSEGGYFVADCVIDANATLPGGLDANAQSAPPGILVGASTLGWGADEQPLHCFFLTWG